MDGGSADHDRFPKRDRLARLTRVATLLHQHAPRGLAAHEVARRIDVSVRTAYRDLRAIERELGFPVWQEEGRWLIGKGDFLPPLKLTPLEAVTLFLSARLVARYADRKDPYIVGAFRKLADALPSSVANHVAAQVQATVVAMSDACADGRYTRVFETIATAWLEARKVRISYRRQESDGRDVSSRRLIWPRYLEPNASGHGCYVIAYDELSCENRTFKLERILEAELTSERFEPSSDPDAPSQLACAWTVSDGAITTVRLLFHDQKAARRALENRWHPSQREQVMPDGRVEMSFEVAGLLEITPWVLTWGDTVEVLEPVELRERVAAIAEGMLHRNAGQSSRATTTQPKFLNLP